MNLLRTFTLLLCLLAVTGVAAQKQLIKKANKLYKLNQYQEAKGLYEEALSQNDNLSVRTKLAYCYRMMNQTQQAEEQYRLVVEKEKARPITYFYYAEALMGNGKYDLAKEWFLKYNEKEPDDQNAVRMAYACDKVKTLQPYFPNIKVREFTHNSDADDSSPLLYKGGIVFTSDRSQGINPLKQKSGWTGRDFQRIYYSEEKGDQEYKNPDDFSKKLNELNKHSGPVSFSSDTKTVVFTRTGQIGSKNNTYNLQLYIAESTEGKKWRKVKLLPFCNVEHNYMHPALSPDGNKLFFVSDKPGGIGGTDIYVAERKGDSWTRPKNLGPVINTSANEAFPFFHSSNKLFFCSKGHLSFGGFDILFSNLKDDNTWQKPVNVGKPINSSYDDISIYLDEDQQSGVFASSRNGGDDDIYIFNVFEGANTELDTLDFEDLANAGPELEGVGINKKLPNQSKIPTISNKVTEEKVAHNMKERPVIQSDNAISHEETQDKPGESDVVENQVVSKPVTKDAVKSVETEAKHIMEKEVETSMVSQEKQTDQPQLTNEDAVALENKEEKINLLDAPPMEEPVAEEKPTNTNFEEAKEIVETPTKTPVNRKLEPQQHTVSKPNETTTKAVNLIIPKKSNTPVKIVNEDPRKAAVIERQETSGDEVLKIDLEESKDVLVQTKTPDPTKDKRAPNLMLHKTKPQESTDKPTNKISDAENSSILDRDPMDKNPPVLLGDEASLLNAKPMSLAELATMIETKQNASAKTFLVEGLSYPKGSYLLSPEATRSLAAIVDLMNLYPDLKIEVGSHTSSEGDDVTNHNLSRKRAMSIKAFLLYKGIEDKRVLAKGFGETQLLNECANGINCSKEKHLENDRVEIKVIK